MAIIFKINLNDYSLSVEGDGYGGDPKCIKDINELQKVLGLKTVSQKVKDEGSDEYVTVGN